MNLKCPFKVIGSTPRENWTRIGDAPETFVSPSVGELKTRVQRATVDAGKKGNDPYYGKGFISAAKAVAN